MTVGALVAPAGQSSVDVNRKLFSVPLDVNRKRVPTSGLPSRITGRLAGHSRLVAAAPDSLMEAQRSTASDGTPQAGELTSNGAS